MEKQIRNRCTLLYDFICEHLNNGLKLLPSFPPPPSLHKYEISIRVEHIIFIRRALSRKYEKKIY